MSYSAVLFDLDGTLLDTLKDLADSANRVLTSRGFPTHPVDAYKHFVGEGVTMLITRVLPEDRRDSETVAACIDAYREDYAKHWNGSTCCYGGIEAVLDELVHRRIKLAVLSNKLHEFTTLCVENFLARWRFDAVVGQTEDRPRKPHPAGAIEIARQLEVAPSDVLYVGDTSTDMLTATAAGMFPVGVLWGFRGREELESAGARAIIAHPRELISLLD